MRPLDADAATHFQLDPEIDFLNHGCFGARPRIVGEAQTRYRAAFERDPVRWLDRRQGVRLEEAKAVVGGFLGMRPEDFGFITNATGGCNVILRGLPLEPGDELVTTTHVYNAVRQTMRYIVELRGATLREVELPLPLAGEDDVFRAVMDGVGPRTRLVIIDHVASPTAVRFPAQRIVDACSERGIDVLVDGAHAPGMLEVDVTAMGAAYYTGNLHKWVCAPVGAAFLWVRPDRQDGVHPNIISHHFGEGLAAEFAWQGTRDITAWLAAVDAIAFIEDRWGWDRVRAHNHELATWAGALLTERWGVTASTPRDGSLLGAMATVALPASLRERFNGDPEALQACLYDEHRFEVPVIPWDDAWWIRVSCQVYNRPEQYERLADTVLALT